jgi:hypothetical protein
VYDSAFRPLAGARVEVLDGPQAGTSATADATGSFGLTGLFDERTRFRASKEGHVAANGTLPSHCVSCRISFYLAVDAPAVDLAGEYTLTFTAHNTCTELPNDVRQRTYLATIAPAPSPTLPANTSFDVTIGGGWFLQGHNRFAIHGAGGYFRLFVEDVWEQVGANAYLGISGIAGGSVETSGVSTISTSFEGSVSYCTQSTVLLSPGCAPMTQHLCQSKNHQLILARR